MREPPTEGEQILALHRRNTPTGIDLSGICSSLKSEKIDPMQDIDLCKFAHQEIDKSIASENQSASRKANICLRTLPWWAKAQKLQILFC